MMIFNISKRTISSLLLLSLTIICFLSAETPSWSTAQEILNRIIPPDFPAKEFNVLEYGAIADGKTLCTEAFAKAITACSVAGGGVVIVPAGNYLTGAIHLRSNVNLNITKGATVLFSTNPRDYLPLVLTRWEGVECMNYSPLIYAYEQSNIAVTGEGVLDGQGSSEHWWNWKGNKDYGWSKEQPNQKKGRDLLFGMSEKGISVEKRLMGDGYFLRPNFVQPYKCTNVLISGVAFRNSPMWFLHPTLCKNVSIINVTVDGHGPNNDGCDPESCTDVLIRGCKFDTGDDCIAIKSGRNADGRRLNVASENFVIQQCEMKDGHGGVVLGSEISGSVRNIFVEDCRMDSPNLDRALRFKTNSVRGGVIENFFARRIQVGQVAEAVVLVDFNYEEGDTGPFTPVMRNVFISDVTARKGQYGFFFKGYERSPITNIVFENCDFTEIEKGNVLEHVKDARFVNVKINGKEYIFPEK